MYSKKKDGKEYKKMAAFTRELIFVKISNKNSRI